MAFGAKSSISMKVKCLAVRTAMSSAWPQHVACQLLFISSGPWGRSQYGHSCNTGLKSDEAFLGGLMAYRIPLVIQSNAIHPPF